MEDGRQGASIHNATVRVQNTDDDGRRAELKARSATVVIIHGSNDVRNRGVLEVVVDLIVESVEIGVLGDSVPEGGQGHSLGEVVQAGDAQFGFLTVEGLGSGEVSPLLVHTLHEVREGCKRAD